MSISSGNDQRLLRFTTAGSVDDGKSSLIGRLLHDAGAVPTDQLAALERIAARNGDAGIDLSLLTDGLVAEREQGITIDVAYRYFATPRRKFIIADTPGHEQYTRNMVTGASTADAAVILVDARNGMTTQTRRHLFLAHLLGIRHLVIAVNKMDLVEFARAPFDAVAGAVKAFAATLGAEPPIVVPLSAKFGDNVVLRSDHLPWYDGEPLLAILEGLPSAAEADNLPLRLPVQLVRRTMTPAGQYRRYLGRVESGRIAVGDPIVALPSGAATRVRAIATYDGPLDHAAAPQSIGIEIDDAVDIARGDVLVHPTEVPAVARRLEATICWFDDEPFAAGRRYLIKVGTRTAVAHINEIVYRLDVTTLAPVPATGLVRNDIARVRVTAAAPLAFDPYRANRATGALILIDEQTHATVAAGMIEG
ncbi:MAG: 50S ribosome-binding GTPase [Alphaproteobacteria bacterium]|nr:50S ribosome-binding GTPase [Alphaproteobacteria bacterium]